MTNKSVRGDYSPNPFYFIEHNEEYALSRIVAFTQDVNQLKTLFKEIIEYFPQEIDVLFKILDGNDFDRFHGIIEKYKLLVTLNKFEEFVFEDGSFQLCIKFPDNDEYVALDEHGVLFIYSLDEFFINKLEKNNFIARKEEMIFLKPHYHHMIKDSEIFAQKFIEELELEEVE